MLSVSNRLPLTMPLLMAVSSTSGLELNYGLEANAASQQTEVVSVLIYASKDAVEPLRAVDLSAGEFQLIRGEERVQIRAELEDETDTNGLWVAVKLDGQSKGERVPLAAATLGVTFALGNNLNMDSNAIVNVAPPTAPDDAATKAYVDNKVAPTCIRRETPLVKLDTWYKHIDQSCALGETLVSGGYRIGNYNTASNCRVVASYPDGNTWRVTWGMPTESECAAHDARTYALCCKW